MTDREDTIDRYEREVEQLAEEHANSRWFNTVCSMCCDRSPLGKEMAVPDVRMANEFEAICQELEAELQENHDDEGWWAFGELSDTYFEVFHETLPEPENCEICEYEDECGHVWHGEECPAN